MPSLQRFLTSSSTESCCLCPAVRLSGCPVLWLTRLSGCLCPAVADTDCLELPGSPALKAALTAPEQLIGGNSSRRWSGEGAGWDGRRVQGRTPNVGKKRSQIRREIRFHQDFDDTLSTCRPLPPPSQTIWKSSTYGRVRCQFGSWPRGDARQTGTVCRL